jgi:hypothetical protein
MCLLALFWLACNQEKSSEPATATSSAPAGPSRLAASHSPSGGEKTFGPMKMTVPGGWVEQAPSSSMRQAQFSLPRAEGDTVDGELVVFYFGAGQGGSVEANIDRWIGQFGQPDGSSSKNRAKTSKTEISGMTVSLVDVTGIYQAPIMPGAPERHNSAGYRMLAAVVETSQGPWFFKLVGPERTIAKWSDSFDQLIKSIKVS